MVEVKALARDLPQKLGVPLSRLHVPDLHAEMIRRLESHLDSPLRLGQCTHSFGS